MNSNRHSSSLGSCRVAGKLFAPLLMCGVLWSTLACAAGPNRGNPKIARDLAVVADALQHATVSYWPAATFVKSVTYGNAANQAMLTPRVVMAGTLTGNNDPAVVGEP